MATVYKRAEWHGSVEGDVGEFGDAVRWAIRGLVRMCEDIAVRPVGALTVVDKTDDPDGPVRAYELQLELETGPTFRDVPAAGAKCPVMGCKTIGFGLTVEAARAQVAKHWDGAHSAGDHFV